MAAGDMPARQRETMRAMRAAREGGVFTKGVAAPFWWRSPDIFSRPRHYPRDQC